MFTKPSPPANLKKKYLNGMFIHHPNTDINFLSHGKYAELPLGHFYNGRVSIKKVLILCTHTHDKVKGKNRKGFVYEKAHFGLENSPELSRCLAKRFNAVVHIGS